MNTYYVLNVPELITTWWPGFLSDNITSKYSYIYILDNEPIIIHGNIGWLLKCYSVIIYYYTEIENYLKNNFIEFFLMFWFVWK